MQSYGIIFSFLIIMADKFLLFANMASFADAKLGKYIIQSFLRSYLSFAGDVRKVGEDEAQVFRYEVATCAVVEALHDTLDIFVGGKQ